MTTLSPYVFRQELDNNGNPLAGGKIYTYEAGTTMPKATYTDSTGNTANANPVILDSAGRCSIWLGDGGYKFVLKTSADVTISTVDNIGGSSDTAFGGQVNALSSNTIINSTYQNSVNVCTGTLTLSLLSVADAGEGFYFIVKNQGSGVITIDPDTSEQVDGVSSITIGAGLSAVVICNGSAWYSLFLSQIFPSGILKGSGTNTTTAAVQGTDYYAPGGTDVAVADGGTGISVALRGHIDGYQMSTAGSSGTMTIGAGTATNSTNAAYLYLSASINKTTSAWAVGAGNGGLDTGTIANSTWYHFYAIRRPDTGVVDVVFSLSASSPTLPTSYTQYRRIGSALTNGSAQWVKFIQYGDKFMWDTSSLDIDVTNPGSSAVTRTLNVPTGIIVTAIGEAFIVNSTSSDSLLISQLSITDSAASNTAWPLCTAASNAAGSVDIGYFECETNTSAQVRSRMRVGTATTNLRISTTGWIDFRGKQ